jgi:hypothetical protein
MSFGRNPHVAKAEAAEQKAQTARDTRMQQAAWLEAGRLWERAADRENDAKRRALYSANADRARTTAESPPPLEGAIAIEEVAVTADKLDPGAN